MLPKKLQKKLADRSQNGSLRSLTPQTNLVDFSSNDYLGYASSRTLEKSAQALLKQHKTTRHGSTGSRLLSGNHSLYPVAEDIVSRFHKSESSVIFNSGYDANIGFFQSVPQRRDLIIYDEFIHASIRDGIQISLARGYKFKHNNPKDLAKLIVRLREMHHLGDHHTDLCIYVVTESVFSMDGDSPNLVSIADVCKKNNALLIVDEAHAVGVMGTNGEGLVPSLGLENRVFARIVTFGKALGSHGAAILGSSSLQAYLINYARSLIYTTALSPHVVAMIIAGYQQLHLNQEKKNDNHPVMKLKAITRYFKEQIKYLKLDDLFTQSDSAIHCMVIAGNTRVKEVANTIQKKGYDVRPILSPTVPKGKERLRICLHAHNNKEQINGLLEILKEFRK